LIWLAAGRRRAGAGAQTNSSRAAFGDGRLGERTRLACRFGRRARTIGWTIQFCETGFRRAAENGNRAGCAPHSVIRHPNAQGKRADLSRRLVTAKLCEDGNQMKADATGTNVPKRERSRTNKKSSGMRQWVLFSTAFISFGVELIRLIGELVKLFTK
jgi:hypothetical protein